MKVIGLDKKNYNLDTSKKRVHKYNRERSQWHIKAKDLLEEIFPAEIILEEIFLPGCPTKLYVDFFLPLRKLMIEVQGSQHFTYNPFFHKGITGLTSSLRRDVDKRQWCEYNNIKLLQLDYKEVEQWKQQIMAA